MLAIEGHYGYSCGECKFTVHVNCAFLFRKYEKFDHPAHDGHYLKLLTTGAPNHTDQKCHICGKNTKLLLFHCSTCNLNLDVDCVVEALCARAHLIKPWHHHPLRMVDLSNTMKCDICHMGSEYGYFCARCRLVIHKGCVSTLDSLEITHTCHVRHTMKLLTNGAPDYTDPECHICGAYTGNVLYHCDKCKFNLDLCCAIYYPPPVVMSDLKIHEHPLTLMPRLISFVCDACGLKGDRAPYVCLQCDFMIIHKECGALPHTIHVNRHDHRVSYTYPLGPGEWKCGFCWEEIDWSYGAYSCSKCPDYAVHPKCATRDDVWDGEELDGVPEEVEDIEPFKINEDNTITHFAHEHNLRLKKDDVAFDESILCSACVSPIGSNTFYKCSDCDFILHETCANFPKKKRHFLSPKPLALHTNLSDNKDCNACRQICCKGFVYTDEYKSFDLLCMSITQPFLHGCHPHPLLYMKVDFDDPVIRTCQCCGIRAQGNVLGCVKCDFYLDFRCATLPLTVRLHRYDDHALTLCYDGKASDKCWCDVCERRTIPNTWFYTCKDCGGTFHVLCVVGDIKYAKPGANFGGSMEVLANNRSSRPICSECHCRCPGPYILREIEDTNILFCSSYCRILFRSKDNYLFGFFSYGICPPWLYDSDILKNL
ncbi:unnamed protein product [Microthlaspi erraticum]|uniref:Phorbol-ester/DAG-type domain-containing protein n=1 Tax=Microthlaspi erraticum TaxID=1685480 RepID=A0A6D2J0I0_9BRAS|nr:unnamed protein product [Microthlaspi erraticum]